MKYFTFLFLVSSSIFCLAQSNDEPAYTLDPSSSTIIGGQFSLNGNSAWSDNGNNNFAHSIAISPYFSLQRSAKRDILLRTNLLYQSAGNGNPTNSNTFATASLGLDWRHQLHQFNKFKVFGSYGPRIGGSVQNTSNSDLSFGLLLGVSANVSLAYEFTQNFRLLTSVFSGNIQYRNLGQGSNFFDYQLRNTLLSPNFSIEYIFPRKA